MSFLFLDSYLLPGLFFTLNFFLAKLILLASFFFSDSKPYVEKVSAYECGFEPDEDARNTFDVRFYIVAMLFLIFDLEALYFFPWCVSLSFLDFNGLLCILDFVFELFVGFIYV